jgi:hypothetical protein
MHIPLRKAAAAFSLGLAALATQAHPIAAPGTEGLAIVVANGATDVIATYLGTTASYSDDLYLGNTFIFNNQTSPPGTSVNLGQFAAGTELVFSLLVNGNELFYSGQPSRNPDGLAHARVEANGGGLGVTLVSFEDLYGDPEGINGFNDLSFSFTNTVSAPAVPEPETHALIGAGLGLLAWMARRRKA